MITVALYARYSSENQRDASIEDQLRLCRLHAERQGWIVVDSYSDRAISGASAAGTKQRKAQRPEKRGSMLGTTWFLTGEWMPSAPTATSAVTVFSRPERSTKASSTSSSDRMTPINR